LRGRAVPERDEPRVIEGCFPAGGLPDPRSWAVGEAALPPALRDTPSERRALKRRLIEQLPRTSPLRSRIRYSRF